MVEPAIMAADAFVIVSACVVGYAAGYRSAGDPGLPVLFGISPIVCALFIPAAKLQKLHNPAAFLSGDLQVSKVTALWLSVVGLLGIGALSLQLQTMPPTDAIIAFGLAGLLGLLGHRIFWRRFIEHAFASGNFRTRKVVLIYQDDPLSDPGELSELRLRQCGFQVERRLPIGSLGDEAAVRQGIEEAIALSHGPDIEELVIAADAQHWHYLKPHVQRLRQLPLPVSLIPRGGVLADLVRRPSYVVGSSVLVELQCAPLRFHERCLKRALDVTCAATALTVLSPLLMVVAALIKLDSPGPLLFRQTRLGFNGRPFRIWKFRTMTVLEDGTAIQQAAPGDERVTSFGRWLRRTSIDELPQLFNVLKGDMSIVGPRPHAVAHDDQYGQLIADYAFRRKMKPGLTGWAQVNGYRGATPKVDLMDRRVRLDIRYIENWSIWLDIGIIARTFVELVRGRNAY
jgi:putative colanic acid biosynthesis UDP-glucose lipid carrier transferase